MAKSRTPEQERQRWMEREWLQERLLVPVDPPLPTPDPAIVDKFIRFLTEIDEKVCRPPRQASKLLAFVVQLYTAPGGPLPFPTRPQVAKHLGVSIPLIDAVLNLHIAEGSLTVETRYRDGNIEQRRASAIKERYIIPSALLIEVYEWPHNTLSAETRKRRR